MLVSGFQKLFNGMVNSGKIHIVKTKHVDVIVNN